MVFLSGDWAQDTPAGAGCASGIRWELAICQKRIRAGTDDIKTDEE
jgi:hypothetical protein